MDDFFNARSDDWNLLDILPGACSSSSKYTSQANLLVCWNCSAAVLSTRPNVWALFGMCNSNWHANALSIHTGLHVWRLHVYTLAWIGIDNMCVFKLDIIKCKPQQAPTALMAVRHARKTHVNSMLCMQATPTVFKLQLICMCWYALARCLPESAVTGVMITSPAADL